MSGLDPVVVWSLRAGLALLFAAAAVHKLRAPRAFAADLADYALLPPPAVAPVARVVPVVEAVLVVGLLVPATSGLAALACAAVLAGYGAAMGINLARGRRHVSCGCFGPAADRPVHRGLVLRNAALACAALLAAGAPAARGWTLLDAWTGAAAVTSLALLYLASEALQASAFRATAS